jgi:hypothetical protein
LVLPRTTDNWSPTSFQQPLVKTGGTLIKHARYYTYRNGGTRLAPVEKCIRWIKSMAAGIYLTVLGNPNGNSSLILEKTGTVCLENPRDGMEDSE